MRVWLKDLKLLHERQLLSRRTYLRLCLSLVFVPYPRKPRHDIFGAEDCPLFFLGADHTLRYEYAQAWVEQGILPPGFVQLMRSGKLRSRVKWPCQTKTLADIRNDRNRFPLPTRKDPIPVDAECSICLSPTSDVVLAFVPRILGASSHPLIQLRPCRGSEPHYFHSICLSRWLTEGNKITCPLCFAALDVVL